MWFFSVFLFFKHKTAYEVRISDWSSDVCSSDLRGRRGDARMVQYAMGVDIFRRVPERRLARRRAAEQNGEFGIEADEAFEYARRALHRLPGGDRKSVV